MSDNTDLRYGPHTAEVEAIVERVSQLTEAEIRALAHAYVEGYDIPYVDAFTSTIDLLKLSALRDSDLAPLSELDKQVPTKSQRSGANVAIFAAMDDDIIHDPKMGRVGIYAYYAASYAVLAALASDFISAETQQVLMATWVSVVGVKRDHNEGGGLRKRF